MMVNRLDEAIKNTAKHSMIYGIGTTLPQIVAIFLLPIIAHCLTSSEFGVYALLQTVATVSFTIFMIGLDSACLRFYYDEKNDKKKDIIGNTIFLLIVITIILNIFGQIGAEKLSVFLYKTEIYGSFIRLIIITSTFKILNAIPFVVFRAKKESKMYVCIQSGSAICRLVAVTYSLIWLKSGIYGILVVDLTISLINCIILFTLIFGDIRLNTDYSLIKRLLKYGIPMVPGNGLYAIINNADRYILTNAVSLSAVGIYFIGIKISQALLIFLSKPFQLIFPAIAFDIDGDEYSKEYYAKIMTHFVLIGMLITLGISLFSNEILLIIGKKEYLQAQYLIPFLLMATLFDGVQKNVQISVLIEKKTFWIPIVAGLACALNIFLNIVLINKIGVLGAAIAILATRIFILIAFYFISYKSGRMSYEWFRLCKIFLSAFFIFGISLVVGPRGFIISVLIKSILFLLYPIFLFILKYYTIEEKYLLKRYFKKPFKKILA